MAGDWIKLEHATPDKPEAVRMAAILGIDQDMVVGKLLRLWVWADQNSISGDAINVTDAFLDRLCHCPGFAAALRAVKWLTGEEGELRLPNFHRHNGQTAKSRALGKDRMAKHRANHATTEECDAACVTAASPEKRREEGTSTPTQRRPKDIAEASAYATAHDPQWPEEEVKAWYAHRDAQGWERTSGAVIMNWRSDLDSWCISATRKRVAAPGNRTVNISSQAQTKESVYSLTKRIEAAECEIHRISADSGNKMRTEDGYSFKLRPEASARVKLLRERIHGWKAQMVE